MHFVDGHVHTSQHAARGRVCHARATVNLWALVMYDHVTLEHKFLDFRSTVCKGQKNLQPDLPDPLPKKWEWHTRL